jgi:hypothetical protein
MAPRTLSGFIIPKDAKAIKERLEEVRGQLLNWEQSDPHGTKAGFSYSPDSYRGQTREELRGWEHALVWVLGQK